VLAFAAAHALMLMEVFGYGNYDDTSTQECREKENIGLSTQECQKKGYIGLDKKIKKGKQRTTFVKCGFLEYHKC
jgi:hypothetical protein